jgi:integrase
VAPGVLLDELAPVRSGAWVRRDRFHALRHGHATLLLASGVSDAVAIKLMGHADSKILRRYQEVVDELQRDAATRMDLLVGG